MNTPSLIQKILHFFIIRIEVLLHSLKELCDGYHLLNNKIENHHGNTPIEPLPKKDRNRISASSILMIRPVDFEYNEQTACDNEFMKQTKSSEEINRLALQEFDTAVQKVRDAGVNVIVFDKNNAKSDLKNLRMPDAVFPNNWLSTDTDNSVMIYTMLTENRNYEKHQFRYIAQLLSDQFVMDKVVNVDYKNQILEGTGTLIVDRVKRRVYCGKSKRAEQEIFENWCAERGYEGIMFESFSSNGTPVYHTNVMMSIGENFAVICADSITDEQQKKDVLEKLGQDREIIYISFEQLEKSFCGNILEVENQEGEKQIFMSQNAYDGFTKEQIQTMEKYGKVHSVPLYNIEETGGGSMRCMMAEIFLQRKAVRVSNE